MISKPKIVQNFRNNKGFMEVLLALDIVSNSFLLLPALCLPFRPLRTSMFRQASQPMFRNFHNFNHEEIGSVCWAQSTSEYIIRPSPLPLQYPIANRKYTVSIP